MMPKKLNLYCFPKGSVPVNSSKKRKVEVEENFSASTKKTKTAQMIMASADSSSPDGLIWDGGNYSCAYDALFTVLFEIWSSDTKLWTRRFKEINQHHLKSLSANFKKYLNGQTSFETARDTIRHGQHSQNPAQFPYGTRGTNVAAGHFWHSSSSLVFLCIFCHLVSTTLSNFKLSSGSSLSTHRLFLPAF